MECGAAAPLWNEDRPADSRYSADLTNSFGWPPEKAKETSLPVANRFAHW
jgi:hypothetical protein